MSKVIVFDDGSVYIKRPNVRWGRVNMSTQPFLMPDSANLEVCYTAVNDITPPPTENKGSTIIVNNSWFTYLDNFHTPQASKWLWTPKMLWCNRPFDGDSTGSVAPPADPQPVTECITGAGNIHMVIGETVSHYEIFAIENNLKPSIFIPSSFNWINYPWIFWKAQARNRSNQMFNVGAGLDVFHLHFRKPGTRHWISKKQLTLFTLPPFNVTWNDAVYTIVDYQFVGASVYGITDHDGRVPLLLARTPNELIYPTEWRSKERPVIPPA